MLGMKIFPDNSIICVIAGGRHWTGIPIAFSRNCKPKELNDEEREVMYTMSVTHSPYSETRAGDQSLGGQNVSVGSRTVTLAQPHSEEHCANLWRAATHWTVLLLFLSLAVLLGTLWDFSRRESPDWKPVLALADTARERGDLYYAKSLYSQAGRLSAWRGDWGGLLAAACEMKKLEKQTGRHSETNALLLSAMVAAKTRQSRSGLVAVAQAFTALGQNKVASMVLSHAGKDWVEEINYSADVVSPDCWGPQA